MLNAQQTGLEISMRATGGASAAERPANHCLGCVVALRNATFLQFQYAPLATGKLPLDLQHKCQWTYELIDPVNVFSARTT